MKRKRGKIYRKVTQLGNLDAFSGYQSKKCMMLLEKIETNPHAHKTVVLEGRPPYGDDTQMIYKRKKPLMKISQDQERLCKSDNTSKMHEIYTERTVSWIMRTTFSILISKTRELFYSCFFGF